MYFWNNSSAIVSPTVGLWANAIRLAVARLDHARRGYCDRAADNPFLRADKDGPRFIAFAQKIGVIPKAVPKP